MGWLEAQEHQPELQPKTPEQLRVEADLKKLQETFENHPIIKLQNARLAAFEPGGAVERLVGEFKNLCPNFHKSRKLVAELEALLQKKEGK